LSDAVRAILDPPTDVTVVDVDAYASRSNSW